MINRSYHTIYALIFIAFLVSMENGTIKHLVPVFIPGNETIATMDDFYIPPQSESTEPVLQGNYSFDPLVFIKQLLRILGVYYG